MKSNTAATTTRTSDPKSEPQKRSLHVLRRDTITTAQILLSDNSIDCVEHRQYRRFDGVGRSPHTAIRFTFMLDFYRHFTNRIAPQSGTANAKVPAIASNTGDFLHRPKSRINRAVSLLDSLSKRLGILRQRQLNHWIAIRSTAYLIRDQRPTHRNTSADLLLDQRDNVTVEDVLLLVR